MAVLIRNSSLIAVLALGLYFAFVMASLSVHQQQLLVQIKDARGTVQYREQSLLHWLPGDRVEAITVPESAVSQTPDLLTQLHCFSQLERVAIEVVTAECPDKVRVVQAASGAGALARYYRFACSGRAWSSTSPMAN